jgi:DNA-binding NtrC family response regulator
MLKTIKILAIDREEIILKSIRKALKGDTKINYMVSSCTTALDGLKLIRSDTFDLVFLDLVLPGLNGIEVLRRIKNIYPAIPVIVMSGFSSSSIHFNSVGQGNYSSETLNSAAGFLLKPFTIEEIKSLIASVLTSKEQKVK